MVDIEVRIPDRIDSQIDRLVEQGDFLNREQAVEELLSMGVSAYNTGEETTPTENQEEMFSQSVADQQDPAMRQEDEGDDYTF